MLSVHIAPFGVAEGPQTAPFGVAEIHHIAPFDGVALRNQFVLG